MKILVLGSGGREYCIIKKLNKNHKIYYYSEYKNINEKMAEYINLGEPNECMKLINIGIDFAIIGPEKYLDEGIVDDLCKIGIPCIGPTKKLAQIETSKSFARELIYKIFPQYCPKFSIFNINDESYINVLKEEIVIKADGLHSGKGVKVWGDHLNTLEEAQKYCKAIHENNEGFIIEEKLYGDEFSLMSFCDGNILKHMPPVQDFKRAYENGPNTGGMGTISCENHLLPFLNEEDIKICHNINETIIVKLQEKIGELYKGIIYGSYMKTLDGRIKVIEFNARFGDPECINILSILQTDFADICMAIVNGTLDKIEIKMEKKATCCKYLVPNGYPINPIKNHEIYFDIKLNWDNVIMANMTYEEKNNEKYYYELGSRTLAIICKADSLMEAEKMVENQIEYITGPLYHRKDIGTQMSNSNYAKAGVNVENGNKVIEKIKKYVEGSFNINVMSKFGDFSGMYSIPLDYEHPILVSSTDGVGTKSIFVLETFGEKIGYQMLGRDLVNHCINDILVKGASPMFFLDYYASSNIIPKNVKYFVKGISDACNIIGCTLIGGETAEMPDVYQKNKCDLVGTMIGIVERDRIIDGKNNIKIGDLVIGLESVGPHTNGYSLIRKINGFTEEECKELCKTHKSYYHEIKYLQNNGINIHGLCHITGGGWNDNLKRVLPDKMQIEFYEYEMPDLFKKIAKKGGINEDEMYRVFNCGIGMMIFVSKEDMVLLEKYELIKFRLLGKVV